MTKPKPRMSNGVSVFNLHVNNAGARADAEFIAQFGRETWEREIEPFHKAGIMSIFHGPPKKWRLVWVALVTAYVNEDRS